MQLFLVRHAHAVTAEENPPRPLSARGREDALRIATFLQRTSCFRPAQVWHSPLRRAHETARALVNVIDPEAVLVETDGLLPDDDPEGMAERLSKYPVDHHLALVGHDPHLSALGSLLIAGRPYPERFTMRKGAVLALERTDRIHKKSGFRRWQVRWHLSPELLPA